MTTEEIIGQKISNLPLYIQQEVLDFVEFLERKIKAQETEIDPDEEEGWEVFMTLEKDALDILQSREVEQEVLDFLDETKP